MWLSESRDNYHDRPVTRTRFGRVVGTDDENVTSRVSLCCDTALVLQSGWSPEGLLRVSSTVRVLSPDSGPRVQTRRSGHTDCILLQTIRTRTSFPYFPGPPVSSTRTSGPSLPTSRETSATESGVPGSTSSVGSFITGVMVSDPYLSHPWSPPTKRVLLSVMSNTCRSQTTNRLTRRGLKRFERISSFRTKEYKHLPGPLGV